METLKTIAEIIGSLAWPITILVCVILFRTQFRTLLQQLPTKVRDASKLSLGSFSMELDTKARQTGIPELTEGLQLLSRRAFEQFLKIHRESYSTGIVSTSQTPKNEVVFILPSDDEFRAFEELERAKFVQFTIPLAKYRSSIGTLPLKQIYQDWSRPRYLPERPLSKDEDRAILNQSYGLTDLGRRALDTIMDTILDHLGK